MDAEYAKKLDAFIKYLPPAYCLTVDGFNKFNLKKKKREYVTRVIKLYFKKLDGLDILFCGYEDDKLTCHYLHNMIHYGNHTVNFHPDGKITIGRQLDYNHELYIEKIEKIDGQYKITTKDYLHSDIVNPILEVANSVDIKALIEFEKKLSYEYMHYPLERVKEACRCLISIRKFRESILNIFPTEVVFIIADKLWNTRKDKVWLPNF